MIVSTSQSIRGFRDSVASTILPTPGKDRRIVTSRCSSSCPSAFSSPSASRSVRRSMRSLASPIWRLTRSSLRCFRRRALTGPHVLRFAQTRAGSRRSTSSPVFRALSIFGSSATLNVISSLAGFPGYDYKLFVGSMSIERHVIPIRYVSQPQRHRQIDPCIKVFHPYRNEALSCTG